MNNTLYCPMHFFKIFCNCTSHFGRIFCSKTPHFNSFAVAPTVSVSSKWDEGGLVPKVHKVIEKYKLRVNDNLTKPSSDGTYCVRHYTCEHWTVDLNKHTW